MILTCPECATSYFVDELRIPSAGRMVKCANCGARWRAFRDGAAEPPPPPDDDLIVEDPTPEDPPPPQEDVVAKPGPRPKRTPPPATTKRSPVLVVGLGVLAALALGIAAAVVLRHQIAGVVPGVAPLFAAIGLPVNTLGLVIEDVASKPGFQAGRPVLSVTGAIRSVRKDAAEAPPIRVNLLDKDGKAIAGVVVQPLNARIPPGSVRYFALSVPDPPAGATGLEAVFDPGARIPAPPAQAAPVVATPAPAEAQSLPPGSPDALEPHD